MFVHVIQCVKGDGHDIIYSVECSNSAFVQLDMTHCSSRIGSNSKLIEHGGLGKQSVEEPLTLLLYKCGYALDSCCMT